MIYQLLTACLFLPPPSTPHAAPPAPGPTALPDLGDAGPRSGGESRPLRDLSADRPDTTESPITVDRGHVQLEISVGDWSRERRDDAVTFMQSNFKYGLDDKTDIQVVVDAYVMEDNASGQDDNGFGDVQLRLKRNLWGNDGGGTALALFPYVKIPTETARSNAEFEGGLIVPFSTALTKTLDLGLMGRFDIVYDEACEEHDFEFLHTAVIGYPIHGAFGGFVEAVGIYSEGGDYRASTNLGLTVQPSADLLLDVGVRIGITDDVDDLGLFLGFTARY